MNIGLDISTSCTGVCLTSSSGQMIRMDYIDLKKQPTLWTKADVVRHFMEGFLTPVERQSLESIFVEENLQVFRRGLSSARTLMTLAKFNGIVCYILREVFGIEPVSINVNEARKSVGLKIVSKKKGGDPTKEQVIRWVSTELEGCGYTWPTKTLRSGPRVGKTILLPACADMADAYVICQAGHALYT